jgi:hypothetical protein
LDGTYGIHGNKGLNGYKGQITPVKIEKYFWDDLYEHFFSEKEISIR